MEQNHHDTHKDLYGTNVPVRFEADWRFDGPTVTGIISVNQQAWVLEDYLNSWVNVDSGDNHNGAACNAVEALLPIPSFIQVTHVELHKELDAIIWFGRNTLWTAKETGEWVLEAT